MSLASDSPASRHVHRLPPPPIPVALLNYACASSTSKFSAKQHAMDRSVPPFWNLDEDEDETSTGGLPGSADNAPPDLAYLSEFFGSLSPAVGVNQQLPESPAGAGVFDCSRHAVKGSTGGAAEDDGAIEEGEEKGGLRRRRKRHRNSEVHNLNERRRRDRLSEKMRTLRSLVPNSQKLDRAALLDKAIDYMKSLQQLLQIMSDSKQCQPSSTPHPAIRCPPLPHFPLFPVVNPSLNMACGGMAPLSMPSPRSSLPWTNYPPLPTSTSVAQFQAPMATQYLPCNLPPQEFPLIVANSTVSTQASKAQAAPLHSEKEIEMTNPEATEA